MNDATLQGLSSGGERLTAEDAVAETIGVSKVFRSGHKVIRALDAVSVSIAKGEFLAVIGPSGAGKSTLLHILGGLDRPSSGHVYIDHVDLYRLSEKNRALIRNLKIGFVFQFFHLLPEFSALENVMLPALVAGRRPYAKQREKAGHLLERFGLKERMDHRPSELSGGESQRVAIARALMNDPELLLCDEPTGNLDSETGELIVDELVRIHTERSVSLMIVTHDDAVKERADTVVYMRDGMIVKP